MREVLRSIVRNGYVNDVDDELQVVASTPNAMTVEIKPGVAWINGAMYKIQPGGGNVVLSVPSNSTGATRQDYVVLRLDLTLSPNNIVAVYKTGTTSPPSLTRTSTQYEIALAQVSVPNGATAISQSNIADKRDDPNLCGISLVTSMSPMSDLVFPGFSYDTGTVVVKYVSSQTDYTPPSGRISYVLSLFNNTGGTWSVSNAAGNVTYAYLGVSSVMSLARPILLANGQTLRLFANTGLVAVECPADGTITPVQASISSASGYTVPTGNVLVVLRLYTTFANVFVYDQAAGTTYRYASYVSAVYGSTYTTTTLFGNLANDIQVPEDPQPNVFFVPGGRDIRASALTSIMGYLRPSGWTFST